MDAVSKIPHNNQVSMPHRLPQEEKKPQRIRVQIFCYCCGEVSGSGSPLRQEKLLLGLIGLTHFESWNRTIRRMVDADIESAVSSGNPRAITKYLRSNLIFWLLSPLTPEVNEAIKIRVQVIT
jgi:hypothetical protein